MSVLTGNNKPSTAIRPQKVAVNENQELARALADCSSLRDQIAQLLQQAREEAATHAQQLQDMHNQVLKATESSAAANATIAGLRGQLEVAQRAQESMSADLRMERERKANIPLQLLAPKQAIIEKKFPQSFVFRVTKRDGADRPFEYSIKVGE